MSLSQLTTVLRVFVMPVNHRTPLARRTASAGPATGSRRVPGHREAASALVDDLAAKLAALEQDVAELRVELAEGSAADDPLAAAGEEFASELRSLLGDATIDQGAVRRAARLAAAEQAWLTRLGEMWDTSGVMAVLGVSKQRVSTLVKQRRLIALPRGARSDFPAWQFAGTSGEDRACLATAHRALVSEGGLIHGRRRAGCLQPIPSSMTAIRSIGCGLAAIPGGC
jgi:hypothetical protein